MLVAEALKSISLYPINPVTIERVCASCGLSPQEELHAVAGTGAYKRATAMVYEYLSTAPQVSEAGASYSLSDTDKRAFGAKAKQLLSELNEKSAPVLGWVGENM